MLSANSQTATARHLMVNCKPSSEGNVAASLVLSSRQADSTVMTPPFSTPQRVMLLMKAGEIVRFDFGTPARGEAGFVRPAIVVTSDDVLDFPQHAVVVVPCTTVERGWLTEVEVTGFGVAQAHLPTTISVDRVVETTGINVGPVALRQIRELIADLLGI